MTQSFQRWKPPTDKRWLILLAGIVWSGVGIRLTLLALGWLQPVPLRDTVLLLSLGIVLALAIYRFGFSRLADKNIDRINQYRDKVCLFAFQEWTSYVLVVVMITLGSIMRRSPFPQDLLAAMYTGIGGNLFLASWHYYASLFAGVRRRTSYRV